MIHPVHMALMRLRGLSARVIPLSSLRGMRLAVTAQIVLVALLCLSFTALAMREWNRVDKGSENEKLIRGNTLEQSPPKRIEVELITVRPQGIEPAEIKRPAGPFVLALDNRTRLAVTLQLNQVGGKRLQELSLSRKQTTWQGLLDLPTGNYVLTEGSHARWVCRFTISPK